MAQTIALQRGTTTVSTSGSASATLFTQSGGTATRVIKNQLGLYFSPTIDQNGVYIAVFHNVSGGQSFLLGHFYRSAYNQSYQFTPGAPSDSQFVATGTGTSNTLVPIMPIITSNGSSGVGSANADNIGVNWPNSNSPAWSLFPANFYMGPSDSISIKVYAKRASGKSVISVTAYISYSFTTITES